MLKIITFVFYRTAVFALNRVVAMRAVTATHTVNNTLCVREDHHSVLGAAVQSSADVYRQCHAVTMSNTLSARSVVSHCSTLRSKSSRVDRTVSRVLYDLVVDKCLQCVDTFVLTAKKLGLQID